MLLLAANPHLEIPRRSLPLPPKVRSPRRKKAKPLKDAPRFTGMKAAGALLQGYRTAWFQQRKACGVCGEPVDWNDAVLDFEGARLLVACQSCGMDRVMSDMSEKARRRLRHSS